MSNLISPQLQILNRLYHQCEQLKIAFPFDYNYLLNNLKEVNIAEFDRIISKNVETAKAKFRKQHPQIKNKKQKISFNIENAKVVNPDLKPKKIKNGKKQKSEIQSIKKVNAKHKFRNPWAKIVFVGRMWRG